VAENLLKPYVFATSSPAVPGGVASASGAGLLAGGPVMAMWGGPRRLVPGILGFEMLVSLCTIAIGLTAIPLLLGATLFVYFMVIALGDGCSQTLWQRKVDPVFQGLVFALRQMITLATVPLGVLVLAPLAEYVFEPALLPGGAWSAGIGQVIGTGSGRGIGFVYLLAGLANICIIGLAFAAPHIRHIEDEIPDGE
jgi:hypothetical protein